MLLLMVMMMPDGAGHLGLTALVRVELLLHGPEPGLDAVVLGLLELRGRPGPGRGRRARDRRPEQRRLLEQLGGRGRQREHRVELVLVVHAQRRLVAGGRATAAAVGAAAGAEQQGRRRAKVHPTSVGVEQRRRRRRRRRRVRGRGRRGRRVFVRRQRSGPAAARAAPFVQHAGRAGRVLVLQRAGRGVLGTEPAGTGTALGRPFADHGGVVDGAAVGREFRRAPGVPHVLGPVPARVRVIPGAGRLQPLHQRPVVLLVDGPERRKLLAVPLVHAPQRRPVAGHCCGGCGGGTRGTTVVATAAAVRGPRAAHRGHDHDRPAAVVHRGRGGAVRPPRCSAAAGAAAADRQQRLTAPRPVGETRMGQEPAVVAAAGRRTAAPAAGRPGVGRAGQHEPAVGRPGDAAETAARALAAGRHAVHAVLAVAVQERTRTGRPGHHV